MHMEWNVKKKKNVQATIFGLIGRAFDTIDFLEKFFSFQGTLLVLFPSLWWFISLDLFNTAAALSPLPLFVHLLWFLNVLLFWSSGFSNSCGHRGMEFLSISNRDVLFNPLKWSWYTYPTPTYNTASLRAQLVKNPPAMQETPVRFLGQEDPLGKG